MAADWPALLLVVLDGHDEKEEQRHALDARQQKEVVVELALVYVA